MRAIIRSGLQIGMVYMVQWRLVIANAKAAITALAKKAFGFITHNAFLSTLSICIASLTYFDAQTSGKEQQKALEEARKALSEVVRSLKTQNGIQEKQLAVIAGADELAKTERERQPKIKIIFQNAPNQYNAINGAMTFKTKKIFAISRSDKQGIYVIFFNTGNKTLEAPRIRITVSPQSVSFLNTGVPQNSKNIVDYVNVGNLEPKGISNTPHAVIVHLDIPDKVEAIDLLAEVSGQNMTETKSLLHLKVTP